MSTVNTQQESYVVVEKRISGVALLLLMMMVMLFLSIAINFYYYNTVQELKSNLKTLSSEIKVLTENIERLSEDMKHYRAINLLLELQVRSLLMKTLTEMGFTKQEIEYLIEKYLEQTNTTR